MKDAMDFNNVTALMFSQAGDVVISDFLPYLGFLTRLQGKPLLYRKTREIVLEMMRRMTNFDERKKLHAEGRSTGEPEDFVDVLLSSTLSDGTTPLPDDICLMLLMVRFFAQFSPGLSLVFLNFYFFIGISSAFDGIMM